MARRQSKQRKKVKKLKKKIENPFSTHFEHYFTAAIILKFQKLKIRTLKRQKLIKSR
jgi:hypothetical protein